MSKAAIQGAFFGWRVVAGAFVLAVFGWGMGFYGPPVFLGVIGTTRGWPLTVISAAITVHFLTGALVAANLPRIYRRFGAPTVTKTAALGLGAGVILWALGAAPWQLFGAALLSGAGWGAMASAAINGIVSPWFVRSRPAALGMAYNGGSVGGVIFSPLWVAAIATLGFASAAAAIAAVMVTVVWLLAGRVFAKTPQQLGQIPDGDLSGDARTLRKSPLARPLPGRQLWRDRRFLTLAAFMAFGLFAQIGLVAHLFSLLTPALGAQRAGYAMAGITAMAIAGRAILGWAVSPDADRRLIACIGYTAQVGGSIAFLCAAGTSVPLLLLGVILFGLGFGNATSLPPLVAQIEFVEADVPRVVALIVGLSQASFAFAPAIFGLVRALGASAVPGAAPGVFVAAAVAQSLAIVACLLGRTHSAEPVPTASSAVNRI